MYSLGDLILTFWFGAGFSLVTVGIIFWRRAAARDRRLKQRLVREGRWPEWNVENESSRH